MKTKETRRLSPGDRAPDVEVQAVDGSVVRTSALWADAPIVLAFMRHFG